MYQTRNNFYNNPLLLFFLCVLASFYLHLFLLLFYLCLELAKLEPSQ